jgi:hypothetical protein
MRNLRVIRRQFFPATLKIALSARRIFSRNATARSNDAQEKPRKLYAVTLASFSVYASFTSETHSTGRICRAV